jgi:hypothetical protein
MKLSLCLTKHHTMKTSGSGDIAPRILNLGIVWGWVVSFMLRPLYSPEKNPLDRRQSWPQSRSGRGGKEKNPCPSRESKPDRAAHSPLPLLTELLWLRALSFQEFLINEPTEMALGSWVRIPLETWMCVRVFLCWIVLSCVGSSVAMGWSPVQGVLPNVPK